MKIANAAYYNTTGLLEIGADDFTAGVSSCALVPTTPTAQHADIGGGVQNLVGVPAWQLQITFAQDHVTAGGLSRKSIEWAGQEKSVTYTPQDGSDPITVDVIWQAAQIGGGAGVPTATLNLGVQGQPIFG